MIGVKAIIEKLNTALLNNNLSELEINQLYSAINSLETKGVSSVATPFDLPNPVTNKGRFFFIESETRYVFSNGVSWGISNIIQPPYPKIWGWGSNASGQLGDNTLVSRSSPVSVVGAITDWTQVSAGSSHTAALRANGTAWAWGNGVAGRLGDNTTVSKLSPVSVVGGFTDWVQISAGSAHTLALRANGTAWGWGSNGTGQLGDNTLVSRSSPVSVVGGITNWIQVSASGEGNVSAGVRSNGTIWCWGLGTAGQLGDNTIITKSSPVAVVGGIVNWVQVAVGTTHVTALRANGTIWGWGANTSGQLGDNTLTGKSSPVSVVGGFTDWVQVSTRAFHTVAIRANGTAWCWGSNTAGQLGNGLLITTSSPTAVIGGFTDWVQVGVGSLHTNALRANGTVWSWGANATGPLGDGTIINQRSPVSAVGGFTDWVQISVGYRQQIGLRG